VGFISKRFVDLSYFLQASEGYQNTKRFFYALLEDQSYPYKKYFDYFMMLLILSSVMLLIRGVKYELHPYVVQYNDYVISIIFMVEYILRLWVHSSVSKAIILQYERDELLGKKFQFFKVIAKSVKEKWKYIRPSTRKFRSH